MLVLGRVFKAYDDHVVLDFKDRILTNKIYWLKGINGSGKTTFLNIVAGLIPFDGKIGLNGIDLDKQPRVYRQMVGHAEADPVYPGFMTGRELIRFYQEIRKADLSGVDELIDLFRMKVFINSATGTYSSGMLKKLSLVLAFIGEPSLILLDEPLATLDEEAIQVLPEFIKTFYSKHDICLISSSHQPMYTGSTHVQELLMHDQKFEIVA